MVESILAGKPPMVVKAEDGLSAVETCETAKEPVKTGKMNSVEDHPDWGGIR